jgi:hypothetical protein
MTLFDLDDDSIKPHPMFPHDPATSQQAPALHADDRGPCQELNADTLARCTGRMIVHYETLHGQIGFPVWTCSVCGRRDVK